jgi:tetratricopeptide (TPR) repeat protein
MPSTLQRAIAAHRAGHITEAETLYRTVLKEQPDRADASFNLGTILAQSGRMAEALQQFAAAAKAKPDFGEAWLSLSECARQQSDYDLHLSASQRATHYMPDNARAWFRHGLALSALQRLDEAVAAYQRALTLDPKSIAASANLSVTLKKIGKPDEAEKIIRATLESTGQTRDITDDAEQHYGLLHWHLALLELARGDYREGFAHFRARFKGGTNWKRLESSKPLWRGEDLKSKTLLVTAEQGHGDVLMMARYLPLLKERGAMVVFQTHPGLVHLFSDWHGSDRVLSTNDSLDDQSFDYHVPVFDLPCRFGTELSSLPAAPYIPAPATTKPLPHDGRKKIGIVWTGQAANPRDALRRLAATMFAEIFALPSFHFFNLTRERTEQDSALLAEHNVTDLSPTLQDFRVTAEVIGQLDLLITCDTAAAHLAGAMGKSAYVLIPFAPDWRWLYDREDSPWYSSLRLFRQTKPDQWDDVLQRVKSAITSL